ncbi:PAS domain-containing protein [Fibrisoma montanum]|uniref:histidine kinase n=1 Tax=Fibrisoma montanum TaxID=2305895 RepID=A0A418MDH3_9BACT|nr:ATP-binding protein [Fibrisoma montanum]RIV24848.1 PAS domain-containing protein [Fibrisoma montanum]
MDATLPTDTAISALWQLALDHSATGIAVYELLEDPSGAFPDFRLLMVNRRASEITGVDLQQKVGGKVSDLFPNVQETGLWEAALQTIRTGQKSSRELLYTIQETGQAGWYDLTISSANDGRHVVFSFTESTEQREQISRELHQNSLLRSILNSALNGVIYYRAIREEVPDDQKPGRIIDFQEVLHNTVAEQQTGQTADDFRDKTMLERYPERGQAGEIANELFQAMIRVTETGIPERRVQYIPSHQMTFDLSMVKLEDGFVISLLNISERIEQLRHIEQQARQFSDLLDSLATGLVIYAIRRNEAGAVVDLVYESISQSVLNDIGRTRDEVVGKGVQELFPGSTTTSLWQKYLEVIETGMPMRFEDSYPKGDTIYYLDISATPFSTDKLLVSYTNTNETRKMLQVLRSQAILFNTMSRNVPDVGALVVNSTLRVVFANGELPEELFPLNLPAGIIDRRLEQALRPTYRTELKQYLQDALAGISRTLIQPVGDRVYEVYVGPVNDEDGTGDTLMAMAIYRNISQARRYQRELEQSVTELKRSNESLEQFAYVASHDLQEPLRKIQAFGDVLRGQYLTALGASGADLVHRMQSAAARMSDLIKDLLEFSRLTNMQQSHELVSLASVVNSVVQDLDMIIQEKRAVIEYDDLPAVMGDAPQLHRLFQNLLSNALKFCKADVPPHVFISAVMVEGRTIQGVLLTDERRSFVRIDVKDNGIGFDEKYIDRIFTIFQRLHGRSQYPGTGIGLAICRKITDNHRGYLRATSQEGVGATFQIFLPIG